ncbi:MAG: citramalate synthase, partial [Deltaproteobacteria bacterium]
MEVRIYDTTLRDGAQSEDVVFSLEDKLRITEKLDELGIHYVEGGWPASNPKDLNYFKEVKKLRLRRARVVAFGSTCRKGVDPSQDENIRQLLEAGTEVVTVFGKSWDVHPLVAMEVTLEENLELIRRSVAYLKANGREVIYDAEHFFDGFKSNPSYALATVKAAEEAGADCIVLCDTNGGTLPHELVEIIRRVKGEIRGPIGIHCHNDTATAVANSI